MIESSASPAHSRAVVEAPAHAVEAASPPAVVITEHEVVFSTTAAVPLPHTRPTRGVIAALRAMLLNSTADARPEGRHYPPRRDEFLEHAAMAREMRRL